MLRAAYLAVYGVFAVVALALVARPAALWWRSQGIFGVVRAWDVPLGGVAFALALAVALFTLVLALSVAIGKRRRKPVHAAFLLLVVACLAVRSCAPAPRPPPDPAPALLEALQQVARALDARYDGGYGPDADALDAVLATAPDPGFRHLAHAVRLHARVLPAATGPQLAAVAGDLPATIYVAIAPDRQTAWLTALSTDGVLGLANGTPAMIEARAGTHNRPGSDPLVPLYPRTNR